MGIPSTLRRPPLGRYGRMVVGALCAYEVVALTTPLPTISNVVRSAPPVGYVLLALLAHHWFVEDIECLATTPQVSLQLHGYSYTD
jgi:hypothetical protein